nr:DUF4276 family protein [Massilistercora timonensis]
MTLVFLLEEASMKAVLDIILPQILPESVTFRTIPHCGKSDLEASIPHKLKAWREPDTRFVIVRDQDNGDCMEIKSALKKLVEPYKRKVLIRIVCKELEAWYFGDLMAVSKAYGKNVQGLARKSRYRIPDKINNPKKELKALFPKHQQLSGARKIAVHMNIENNSSESFNQFISGVRKLAVSSE